MLVSRSASLCACLAVTACSPNEAPNASTASIARPDILLISIDSLRADHLGCYGYAKPTSPHIDALARSGVRCTNAMSTTSWTLPAHAALFTGLHDSTHGVVDNGLALAPKITTLAETLRAHGWRTAGFYGGPYLHPVFGLSQGFESWDSCMTMSGDQPREDVVRRVLDVADRSSANDVTGPRTLAAVRAKLASADADEPLFLFVHLWDVHYDYRPEEKYWRRFDPDWNGTLDANDFAANGAIRRDMAPRDLEHVVALYDGEIAATDDVVGGILAAWDEARGSDTSLVVVAADHGEEFFEHGNKGHQHSLFEEVVHVPLVVRWPGHFDGGRVVDPVVRLIDVMPTICAAAGVTDALDVEGRDVTALLRGGSLPAEPALCELLVDGGEIRALREEHAKTIRYKDGRLELAFDLEHDPRELAPLPAHSAELTRGLAELERARADAHTFAGQLGAPPLKIDTGAAIERSLSGLGYGGDDPRDDKKREERR